VSGEGVANRLAGGQIPQLHWAGVVVAGQGLAVRAERQRVDIAGVAGEGFADLD
jgi:hypothetical protein